MGNKKDIYLLVRSIFLGGRIFKHKCYFCIKNKYNREPDKIIINYIVKQKNIFALIGIHTPEHIQRNLNIIDEKIWRDIEKIVKECCGDDVLSQ